jgi:hypothetical protein
MTHRILSWSLVAILGLATLGCGNTGGTDAKKESQPAVTPPAATDDGSGTKAPAEPKSTEGSGTTGSGSR